MKRQVCIALAFLFMFSLITVPVQAKKAGEVKDKVYTDFTYAFSFSIPGKWSVQVKKSKSPLRLSMEERSPVPPQQFQGELRDYMQIPMIKVLADTTSLTCDQFVKNMLDDEFKSKQKKFFMKSLNLISKPHDILKQSDMTFAGSKAIMIEARQPYSMEVSKRGGDDASDRGSDRADVINDNKSGAIFLTVRDGHVIIFHMICEYKTSLPLMGVFNNLVKSLKFNEEG